MIETEIKVIALTRENEVLKRCVEKLLLAVDSVNDYLHYLEDKNKKAAGHECKCTQLVPGDWYTVELWVYDCAKGQDPEFVDNEYVKAQYGSDGHFYIDDMPVSVHGYVVPYADAAEEKHGADQ